MSETPAKLYGLFPRKGSLSVGADADLVLADLQTPREIHNADVHARVGWTPYDGRTIRGTPKVTIARGRVLFEEGQVVGDPGWGRYLPRPGSKEVSD
jgi:dihydroorotase-like cyclic amidohydrolase